MDSVGIKQLKFDTSGILRRVRVNKETIEVTYRGKLIAHIVPVQDSDVAPAKSWEDV